MRRIAIGLACATVGAASAVSALAQDGASVVLSQKTVHGVYSLLVGGSFALINSDSEEVYPSRPLHPFLSKHAIVSDLPTGSYLVLCLCDYGLFPIADSSVQNFFGPLDIADGKTYYLGDFAGKIEVGWDKPLSLTLASESVPDHLAKALVRRRVILPGEKLVPVYPYEVDTLVIH